MSTAEERRQEGTRKGIETQRNWAKAKERMLLVILADLDEFTMAEARVAPYQWDLSSFAERYGVPYYALRWSWSTIETVVRKWFQEGLLERRHVRSARSQGRHAYLYSWVE